MCFTSPFQPSSLQTQSISLSALFQSRTTCPSPLPPFGTTMSGVLNGERLCGPCSGEGVLGARKLTRAALQRASAPWCSGAQLERCRRRRPWHPLSLSPPLCSPPQAPSTTTSPPSVPLPKWLRPLSSVALDFGSGEAHRMAWAGGVGGAVACPHHATALTGPGCAAAVFAVHASFPIKCTRKQPPPACAGHRTSACPSAGSCPPRVYPPHLHSPTPPCTSPPLSRYRTVYGWTHTMNDEWYEAEGKMMNAMVSRPAGRYPTSRGAGACNAARLGHCTQGSRRAAAWQQRLSSLLARLPACQRTRGNVPAVRSPRRLPQAAPAALPLGKLPLFAHPPTHPPTLPCVQPCQAGPPIR